MKTNKKLFMPTSNEKKVDRFLHPSELVQRVAQNKFTKSTKRLGNHNELKNTCFDFVCLSLISRQPPIYIFFKERDCCA